MDDNQDLLQELSRLDAAALARVFDRYASDIYKYAFRHCGNALLADQTVGEVFAKLLEQLAQGRGPRSNLRAYLFEIAYHAVVDEIRHSQRVHPLQAIEFALDAAGSPDLVLEEQLLLDVVWRAIREDLTGDQRHVIILRFLEDFSLKETARIMGKNLGNIKVLQQRAVAILRRAIERQELADRLLERAALSERVF